MKIQITKSDINEMVLASIKKILKEGKLVGNDNFYGGENNTVWSDHPELPGELEKVNKEAYKIAEKYGNIRGAENDAFMRIDHKYGNFRYRLFAYYYDEGKDETYFMAGPSIYGEDFGSIATNRSNFGIDSSWQVGAFDGFENFHHCQMSGRKYGKWTDKSEEHPASNEFRSSFGNGFMTNTDEISLENAKNFFEKHFGNSGIDIEKCEAMMAEWDAFIAPLADKYESYSRPMGPEFAKPRGTEKHPIKNVDNHRRINGLDKYNKEKSIDTFSSPEDELDESVKRK